MELLIVYLLLVGLYATINLNNVDESINSMKIVLASIVQPILIPFKLLNLVLPFLGIYLQLDVGIIPNKKEQQQMTDKQVKDFSDRLKKALEESDKKDD